MKRLVPLLLASCVSEPSAVPCTTDGRCLPSYTCIASACVPCSGDECETSFITLISTGGGLACGDDETCARFPPGSLVGTTEIEVARTTQPTTSIGRVVLSRAFAVRPLTLVPLQEIELTFKVSRQVELTDTVTIYRTLDPRGTWEPLRTSRDSLVRASAFSDGLGFFALARGNAGPSTDGGAPPPPGDPIPGFGAETMFPGGATGLHGLAWDPMERRVLFADFRAERVYAFDHVAGSPPGNPIPYRSASAATYGLAVDATGRVLMAELGGRAISLGTGTDMSSRLITDFQGQRFSGPADVAVRSDGAVYFTDPRFNLMGAAAEIAFNGVFLRTSGGALTAEWQGPANSEPRGIELSPDERTLYVTDAAQRAILAWDVAANGALSGMRTFGSTDAAPDGVAVDGAGNVYVGTVAGIEVFSPTGQRWGLVPRTGGVQSIAFGGPGLRTLYVTSESALSSFPVTTPGAR